MRRRALSSAFLSAAVGAAACHLAYDTDALHDGVVDAGSAGDASRDAVGESDAASPGPISDAGDGGDAGACGGVPCAPIVLATGRTSPLSIAVSDTHVFFSEVRDPLDFAKDAIARVEKTKGCPLVDAGCVDTVVSDIRLVGAIAVGGGRLCWAWGTSNNGRISCTASIGQPGSVFAITGGLNGVFRLTVTDDAVFWISNLDSIHRKSFLDGGADELLASTEWQTTDLEVAADRIAWTVISSANDGGIWTALHDGGAAEQIAPAATNAGGIARHRGVVYGASNASGTIVEVIPPNAPRVIAQGERTPVDVVASDDGIYWINQGTPPEYADGEVVALRHGKRFVLATAQKKPFRIAQDETHVYWVNQGSIAGEGSVMAAVKAF